MNKGIIITTINYPTKAVKIIADKAKEYQIPLYIIGDKKTPSDFSIGYGEYYDIKRQTELFPEFSRILPYNHYSRKNIGYLMAFREGKDLIQETDDDNIPLQSFWEGIETKMTVKTVNSIKANSWCNVFKYYSSIKIWPRGYPLEVVNREESCTLGDEIETKNWSIINGLANENPDVDAIFRLTGNLPIQFRNESNIYIEPGLWSPFNSQNTVFKREVIPLMYLPSYCSFRMTDIWRSFIAQRCLWEKKQGLIFTAPTVYQERNEHNLLKDFEDEVPGYLNNQRIIQILTDLKLSEDLHNSLYTCYVELIKEKIFPPEELELVGSWLNEIK